MAIQYLEVAGITEASKQFRSKVKEFDQCVVKMNQKTNQVTEEWIGKGSDQFQTQMSLMKSQLDDISDILYEIYEALRDAEVAYIDADTEMAKQMSVTTYENQK